MIIRPGTSIYVLKNVPLDSTYEHTLYWTDAQGKTAQFNYFNDFVKYRFLNQTYQRVEKGWCMVDAPADNLYDCNYLIFQNATYGDKYFYCFISGVEYVNNKTTRISFEIDVLQTWHFDYVLEPCYIDRIHTTTDVKGENILEEKLEHGDYWYSNTFAEGYGQMELGENYIVVAGTVRPKDGVTHNFEGNVDEAQSDIESAPGGGMYGGIYSGLVFNVFRYPVTVNEFIDACVDSNKADGIVNVFMAPAKFFSGQPIDYNREDDDWSGVSGTFWPEQADADLYGSPGYSSNYVRTPRVVPTTLVWPDAIPDVGSSYVPRNKKLLCWPYCFITVTNNNGVAGDYRYEFFDGGQINFETALSLSTVPECICYPLHYKRITRNYLEKLVINDFPQCAYNVDAYKAWLAQNANSLSTGLIIDTIGIGLGAAMVASGVGAMGGAMMAVGSASKVLGRMAEISDHSSLPPQAKGSQSKSAMTALGAQGFMFYNTHITKYYAMMLDKFFDRFGYVCNKIQTPNRNSRPIFTYIKTISCEINSAVGTNVGGLPAGTARQICEIYDRGVTWWKTGTGYTIGSYTDAVFNANQAPHS